MLRELKPLREQTWRYQKPAEWIVKQPGKLLREDSPRLSGPNSELRIDRHA